MPATSYTIKRGDTLSGIARKYGLKGWKDIYEAPENKKFKKDNPDPNKISPGGKLFVPPSPKTVKSIHKKDMPRMSISVDATKALIFVQQKWEYTFVTQKGVSKWTGKEKKDFHNAADKAIWARWSGKYKITCSGTSDFARVYKDTVFDVSFDIKYVKSGGHWKVTVTKVPKGSKSPTSSVDWNKQTINLDSEDTKLKDLQGTGKKEDKQSPFAHEFGHAVGNSKHGPAGHGDEYKKSSGHFADKSSMMNIGNKLKKRHADHLIMELNKMIKSTTFSVKSVG